LPTWGRRLRRALARFTPSGRVRGHVDLFLYCPYHPAGIVEAFTRTSEDRKPRPGMANAAARVLNLDLTASWVVGDRPEDIGLAEAVRASAIYLGTGDCQRPGVRSFRRT
jgi:histidinol phosphatase-like enzyme